MQVSKWGNSLAIRIPASVVDALALKEGDNIEVRVPTDRVFELARKPNADDLLKSLRKFRGKLPSDFTLNRDEANER